MANLVPGFPGFTTGWAGIQVQLRTGISGDPFSGNQAALITENSTNAPHYISASISIPSNAVFSMSCYVAMGSATGRNVMLLVQDTSTGSNNAGTLVNPIGGGFVTTFTTGSGIVYGHNIAHSRGSWYQVSMLGAINATKTGATALVMLWSGASESYSGHGVANVMAYGADVELLMSSPPMRGVYRRKI